MAKIADAKPESGFHAPGNRYCAAMDDNNTESAPDAIALRVLQGLGLLVVVWVCWLSLGSVFPDGSGFWPRLVLVSFLEQFFG